MSQEQQKSFGILGKSCNKSQVLASNIESSFTHDDFAKLSVIELISEVLMRNKDRVIEVIMHALISKLSQEMSERIEM